MGKFLSETKAEVVEQEEEVPEKQTDDYLLESCVFVSEDKMQASINFSLASEVLKEELSKMDVEMFKTSQTQGCQAGNFARVNYCDAKRKTV